MYVYHADTREIIRLITISVKKNVRLTDTGA